MQNINPSFSTNNIPIVFSCDNNYAPYLSVAIQSIIENATANNNYDIFVLDEDFNQHTKNKILSQIKGKTNINITFIAIKPYLQHLDKSIFYMNKYFTIATYFRFFIPRIFSNFNKVLYLDADLVTLEDVSNLYNINLEGKILAATKDIAMTNPNKTHLLKKLTQDNINNYFQAGVLIFNIQKMITNKFEESCINRLIELKNPCFVDQDVLNSLYYNDVKWFGAEWNIEWHLYFYPSDTNYMQQTSLPLIQQYLKKHSNPKIIHYCSDIKPWNNPNLPLANYFWQYAKNTAYYEEILFNNLYKQISYFVKNHNKIDIKEIYNLGNFFNFYLLHNAKNKQKKLLKYKILSKITFGKLRKKYKTKYTENSLFVNSLISSIGKQ